MAQNNEGGGRYDFRSQLIGCVNSEPTRFQDSAKDESANDLSYRLSFRKDFLEKVQNAPAQSQAPLAGKLTGCFCSKCHANTKQRPGSKNFQSKIPIAPYQAEISRTMTSAERYKDKMLRAKAKMRECEAKYPQEHQRSTRLSGGDADRLLNDRAYTPCCDNICCPRRALNHSPQQLGQRKTGEAPAKPSPQEQQGNCSFYSDHFADSVTAPHSDDDNENSSSTVSTKPSVREIRKVMTSRCRVHEIITASLKTMGRDDDEVAPKTYPKDQSPAEKPRNIPPRPTKPSPRPCRCKMSTRGPPSRRNIQSVSKSRLTPAGNVTHKDDRVVIKVERKPQKLHVNAKPREISVMKTSFPPRDSQAKQRATPIQQRDTSPVTKPAPNVKENLQTESFQLIPPNDPIHTGTDFENTIRNTLHAQAISPMIMKLEKMHLHSLHAQLSLLDDLAALPDKMSQIFKAQSKP